MPAKKRITKKQTAARAARSKAARAAAPKSKKTASRKSVRSRVSHAVVTLLVDGSQIARVEGSPLLREVAAKWMYVMRNRCRWAGDDDLRAQMCDRAYDDCIRLGIGEAVIDQMVVEDSRTIEIDFHWPGDGKSLENLDAACCLPWEFVLSSATRAAGRSRPILITRRIAPAVVRASTTESRLLYIESAPGRIADWYSFDSERERLQASMGKRMKWSVRHSPSISQLENSRRIGQASVVHFSGVDNHQAPQVMEDFYTKSPIKELMKERGWKYPPDGAILRGAQIPEDPIPHGELADLLVGANRHPTAPVLVTLNAYYSAARTARDCVRAGARAAIGFLDEVDDDVAEFFFQAFYREWRGSNTSANKISDAFEKTWRRLREQGTSLFGTGIVLWLASNQARAQTVTPDDDEQPETREPGLPTQAERDAARELPMSKILQVDLQLREDLNYSLLHNSRPLVEALTLNKLTDHPLDEVTVEVHLNAGDASLPFRHTEGLLDQPHRALANQVRIPLTAELLRASRERVQSTLYAKVSWDGRTALEETRAVTLLPVDEWYDDTTRNPWLPSFVLPRDPAVAKIIGSARRHLVTLQDDPSAGFDGYQSVDHRSKEWNAADEQVQAIWTALVQDFRIAYINPPPAYSVRNQRLRTPSEMLSTASGTCIDLALLLASCLEYIDIYPVVVLLTGHAFVGYWRASEYHDQFAGIEKVPSSVGLQVGVESVDSLVPLVDPYGWRLAGQQYPEILERLRARELYFLEATGLCFNYSFAKALQEGRADIRSQDDFDSLLDIALARRARPPVTPLPVVFSADR